MTPFTCHGHVTLSDNPIFQNILTLEFAKREDPVKNGARLLTNFCQSVRLMRLALFMLANEDITTTVQHLILEHGCRMCCCFC